MTEILSKRIILPVGHFGELTVVAAGKEKLTRDKEVGWETTA